MSKDKREDGVTEMAGEKAPRRAKGVGFAAMQAFINKSEAKGSAATSIGSPVESPAFRRKEVESAPAPGAAFSLALPVSKQALEMTYMELDPRECFPSPLNPRVQALLSLDDPEIARIKESFERESQREPVKARLVKAADGRSQWEVIEGTTRLFIAKSLTAERGSVFPLKAWVGPIPDADIRRLAKAENRDRRDLSPWETAKALAEDVQSLYKNRSQEYIAEQEGWSQTIVSHLLKLAELDHRVVQLVATPGQISLKAGIQLVDLWARVAESDRGTVLAELHARAPFVDAAGVARELKAIEARKAAMAVKLTNKPMVVETKRGEVIARLSPHRTNAGQYKLDIFSFTDADALKVVDFIKKLRGS